MSKIGYDAITLGNHDFDYGYDYIVQQLDASGLMNKCVLSNVYSAVNGKSVFGVENKIWKIFHLGWTARYKNRISGKSASIGEPWYVPGFGKSGTTVIGGTFNLIFDI